VHEYVQYGMVTELNIDWTAKSGRLNLAHIQSKSKISEGSLEATRKTVKERIFETDEF